MRLLFTRAIEGGNDKIRTGVERVDITASSAIQESAKYPDGVPNHRGGMVVPPRGHTSTGLHRRPGLGGHVKDMEILEADIVFPGAAKEIEGFPDNRDRVAFAGFGDGALLGHLFPGGRRGGY